MTEQSKAVAQAFAKADASLRRYSLTMQRAVHLAALRTRAEHFATPNWQRPFRRLHARLYAWRWRGR